MKSQKKKAIIFDFDGVIANTEPLFMFALIKTLKLWNITISEEEYIEADLQNGISILTKLFSTGIIKNEDDLSNIKDGFYYEYKEILKKKVRLFPKAKETIIKLKNQYKLAIASSSRCEYIEFVLNKFDLLTYFDVIITKESVNNNKPSPDCYLEAVKRLKLNRINCIAIEDSLKGVKASKAAKIKVIVIPNDLTKNGNYDGEIVIKSLNDLENTLKNLKSRQLIPTFNCLF